MTVFRQEQSCTKEVIYYSFAPVSYTHLDVYKRQLKVCGSMEITYQGKQIDLGHWERLTMVEAVKKYSGCLLYTSLSRCPGKGAP